MVFRHVGNEAGGAFVAQQSGRPVGKLAYIHRDGQVVINLTWVDPRLRGQGVAKKLVRTAMTVAQRQQWDVVPECSYVQYALANNPQWSAAQAV